MKLSIEIPDALLEEANDVAAQEDTEVAALVEEGLRRTLAERMQKTGFNFKLVAAGGGGVRPDVPPDLPRHLAYEDEIADRTDDASGVSIALSADEALVLFELLCRLDEQKALEGLLEDKAEQTVLWRLEGALERVLVEPFRPDYGALLKAARRRLRWSWGD